MHNVALGIACNVMLHRSFPHCRIRFIYARHHVRGLDLGRSSELRRGSGNLRWEGRCVNEWACLILLLLSSD
jgi:hypothetical protein